MEKISDSVLYVLRRMNEEHGKAYMAGYMVNFMEAEKIPDFDRLCERFGWSEENIRKLGLCRVDSERIKDVLFDKSSLYTVSLFSGVSIEDIVTILSHEANARPAFIQALWDWSKRPNVKPELSYEDRERFVAALAATHDNSGMPGKNKMV